LHPTVDLTLLPPVSIPLIAPILPIHISNLQPRPVHIRHSSFVIRHSSFVTPLFAKLVNPRLAFNRAPIKYGREHHDY